MMIFVTQTKTGTMVKRVPQEQMVGVRSYRSRELFSPLFRVYHAVSFRDVLDFKFLQIISSKAKVFSDREQVR